jgi:hypothetical protein
MLKYLSDPIFDPIVTIGLGFIEEFVFEEEIVTISQ